MVFLHVHIFEKQQYLHASRRSCLYMGFKLEANGFWISVTLSDLPESVWRLSGWALLLPHASGHLCLPLCSAFGTQQRQVWQGLDPCLGTPWLLPWDSASSPDLKKFLFLKLISATLWHNQISLWLGLLALRKLCKNFCRVSDLLAWTPENTSYHQNNRTGSKLDFR